MAKKPTTTRTDEENVKMDEVIKTEEATTELTKEDVAAAPQQYSVDKTETGHVVIDKFGSVVREYFSEDCKSEECAKSYADKLNGK